MEKSILNIKENFCDVGQMEPKTRKLLTATRIYLLLQKSFHMFTGVAQSFSCAYLITQYCEPLGQSLQRSPQSTISFLSSYFCFGCQSSSAFESKHQLQCSRGLHPEGYQLSRIPLLSPTFIIFSICMFFFQIFIT